MNIRPAVKEDCPALLELIRGLALFERDPEAVTVTLEEMEQAGFGPHPIWWAYVAEEDGNVVAFALYYLRYSTWKGTRLYLEDIYVDEAFRGRGIGHLLMEQLIAVAKEKGYSGMMWQVLDWNESAIRFYERYGATFDGEWLNVHLELGNSEL